MRFHKSLINIKEFLKKRIVQIYIFSFSLLILTSYVILPLSNISPKNDWWFEITSKKLATHSDVKINWGISKNMDMPTDYLIQKGTYYNWRQLGYSLFLFLPAKTKIFKSIYPLWQSLFLAFIPVFIFLIAKIYFKNNFAFLATAIFIFYPKYLVSAIQIVDTWLITLTLVVSLYFLIRIIYNIKVNSIIWILFVVFFTFLFLTRSITIIAFLFTVLFMLAKKKIQLKKALHLIFFILFAFFSNISIQNLFIEGFYLHTSNLGYNLWLGNNEYTNEYLVQNFGDGSLIEDSILSKTNKKFVFVKNKNEYEKDELLKEKAIEYILENPIEFIKNSFWKFVGFWSPIRSLAKMNLKRERTKSIINFFVESIILFPAFIIITLSLVKKINYNEMRNFFIIFIFFWSLPYLLFFSIDRFRTPIEFILIFFLTEFIYIYFNKKEESKRVLK